MAWLFSAAFARTMSFRMIAVMACLRCFCCGSELFVLGLHVWIEPHSYEGWHVERLSHLLASP